MTQSQNFYLHVPGRLTFKISVDGFRTNLYQTFITLNGMKEEYSNIDY